MQKDFVASCVGAAQPPVSARNRTTVLPDMIMAEQVAFIVKSLHPICQLYTQV